MEEITAPRFLWCHAQELKKAMAAINWVITGCKKAAAVSAISNNEADHSAWREADEHLRRLLESMGRSSATLARVAGAVNDDERVECLEAQLPARLQKVG